VVPGGATDALLQLGPAIALDGRLLPAPAAAIVLAGYTAAATALIVTPRKDVL
jgi:hypothetical protein